MDATLQLVAEEGPAAVTHQRVAQIARVSRSTLYRYWPQPEDLLFESLTQIVNGFDFTGPGRLRDELIGELERRCGEMNQPLVRTAFNTVMSRAPHDPAAAELRNRLLHSIRQGLGQSVQRGIERGELRPGLDADVLVAKVLGPLTWWSFVEERDVSAALIEETVRDALAGWEIE
jgi:AcrR family transcriptional regulator